MHHKDLRWRHSHALISTMLTLLPTLLAIAVAPADSALWQMSEQAFVNPAVKQWMHSSSHSSIGVRYHNTHFNNPIDLQQGSGDDFWTFEADTYLKYKSSTLWGEASYRNGHQRDQLWNETSDTELVYPYFTADSVGGDMNMELYRFSGGYADHTDRWAWGAQIGYTAGLYYRNVDPRPRNVTGRLDISAGGAVHIGSQYFAGLSINYRKYKQSNDIDFKSQMGVDKVYHTTGMGTHYVRFAGSGTDTYYTGNRWGMTANLYPSSQSGFVATANISRFTFSKILSDMNKLPLADVWHNALTTQMGYKHRSTVNDWAVFATFDIYRRHGIENQFGDASSSIYPKIGAITMYADNAYNIRLSGLWQWLNPSGILVWIKPEIHHSHRRTIYLEPQREMLIDNAGTTLSAFGSIPMSRHWRISIQGTFAFIKPTSSSLRLDEAENNTPQGLIRVEQYKYHYLSHSHSETEIKASASRTIKGKMYLSILAMWRHANYINTTHANSLDVGVAFNF